MLPIVYHDHLLANFYVTTLSTTNGSANTIRYCQQPEPQFISSLGNIVLVISFVVLLHTLDNSWIRLCTFMFDMAFSRKLGKMAANRLFGFMFGIEGNLLISTILVDFKLLISTISVDFKLVQFLLISKFLIKKFIQINQHFIKSSTFHNHFCIEPASQ